MSSLAAANVAKEVLGTLGKGKRPSVRAIAPKHGYTPGTANSGAIQKTKSYKRVVSPVIDAMLKARDKALKELNDKDLTIVNYDSLITGINKLTHDIQILGGKATENIAIVLSVEDRAKLDLLLDDKQGRTTESN